MTDLLEDLVNVTRQVGSDLTGVQAELARTHEEVWRNREMILQTHRDLGKEQEAVDLHRKATQTHDASTKAAHEEHQRWEKERQEERRRLEHDEWERPR